jgi:hypothetical protein
MAVVKHVLCGITWCNVTSLNYHSQYFRHYIEIYGFSISHLFLTHGYVAVFKVFRELWNLGVMSAEIFENENQELDINLLIGTVSMCVTEISILR